MSVQKLTDQILDGVIVSENWDAMVLGASFFVPCINIEKATKQTKDIALIKDWKIVTRVTIEDNKLGVRVWRVL